MKCPKCGAEINTERGITSFDNRTAIVEMESKWPVILFCRCKTTYECGACSTSTTTTEAREYIPKLVR